MSYGELDQKIKQAVKIWREKKYEGASEVTRRLLEFWFLEEHILKDGSRFEFWCCQREAIEALIYIYEVCGYKSLYELSQGFQVSILFDPTKDRWSRYCFKMATGSGKTLVMALAFVWQYFNKFFGTGNGVRYSNHFLLVSPNLIVLDRLGEAFNDNIIFKEYPVIPKEWEPDFDLQVILQSQDITPHSRGILHLTNVQQLYEHYRAEPVNPVDAYLGVRPIKGAELTREIDLRDRLKDYDDLLIMNDEAHHVHREDLEWNKAITDLDKDIRKRSGSGLVMQLDFTATPKDLKGNYFPHIIYNYPLAEAIKDKIVKRPRIGIIENIPEPLGKGFVAQHRIQIDTGVEKLREFQKKHKLTGKKPVLFIMTDNTRNADRVGEYLERDKGFEKKVLVIHTDVAGVITKKDLDIAREAARGIDNNQYEIITSVMMLKEGWDVKNVCVIVPLRAFDSPILPEQTLGRGLRRIISYELTQEEEYLVVIDHPRFRELWQAEIDKGEIVAEIVPIRDAYQPSNSVIVDPNKLQYDLTIPVVEGGMTRVIPDLSKLDVGQLPQKQFVFSDIELPKIMYTEKDLLTQKITEEKELAFDYTENRELYLSFIARAILAKVGASSQFAQLIPKLRLYIENYLFDCRIDMQKSEVVKKLNFLPIREKIREAFVQHINDLSRIEEEFNIVKYYQVSETKPFHTSEPIYNTKRTVFNCLPYSKKSEYEKHFMQYLDEQKEVIAYTKILPRFPIHIPYYNQNGYLRHYIPDFIVKVKEKEKPVVVKPRRGILVWITRLLSRILPMLKPKEEKVAASTEQDIFYLIETKGLEELELPLKIKAAKRWCEWVSHRTDQKWVYVKILKSDFERLRGYRFSLLVKGVK